jgi:cytochrome bd-type quinol oxidase subunit 2
MPSWLTGPTVAILGFVATVVSIVQGVVSVTNWFMGRTEKPSARRRLAIFTGIISIIAVAVLAPLTWSMIMGVDEKSDGNPAWVAGIYPVIVFVPAIMFAVLLINHEFKRESATISAFLVLIVCLALPTITFDYINRSIWERYLVNAAPGFAVAMVVITFLAYFLPRAKPNDADARKLPNTAEKAP